MENTAAFASICIAVFSQWPFKRDAQLVNDGHLPTNRASVKPVSGRLVQLGSFSNDWGRKIVLHCIISIQTSKYYTSKWTLEYFEDNCVPSSSKNKAKPKQISKALACTLTQQRSKESPFLLRSRDICRCGFIAQRGNGQLLHSPPSPETRRLGGIDLSKMATFST